VQYVKERLPFPQTLDESFMWKLLSTKSVAWKYEKEWRVFLRLEEGIWNQSAGRILYFADFRAELVLREVALGAANKNTLGEVYDTIQRYPETVRVARMLLSGSKFELQASSAQ